MTIFPSIYIVTDSNYDCGSYFNVDILISKSIDYGFYLLFLKHSRPINGEMLCQKDELIMAMVSSSS